MSQLSASSAYHSAKSGSPWPSLSDSPQHPSRPSNAMQRVLSNSATGTMQPSPLSGMSCSADAESNRRTQTGIESNSTKHDSLAQRLRGLQLASGALDCATAGSSAWAQRTPAPTSSGAGPPSVSPWGPAGPDQQESHVAQSSAASNTPLRGGSPDSRGASEPIAMPGSAVSVTSRPVHIYREGQGTPGAAAWSSHPAEPPNGMAQTGASKAAELSENQRVPGAETLNHNASIGVCEGAGQPQGLPAQARRAAALHSALIRHTAAVQLAAELECLLRLLAVPPTACVEANGSRPSLFLSGRAAAQYACCVLSAIGMPKSSAYCFIDMLCIRSRMHMTGRKHVRKAVRATYCATMPVFFLVSHSVLPCCATQEAWGMHFLSHYWRPWLAMPP